MAYVRAREEKKRGSSGVVGVSSSLSVLQQLSGDLLSTDPGSTVTCLPPHELFDHKDSSMFVTFVTLLKGMEYCVCHHSLRELRTPIYPSIVCSSHLGDRKIFGWFLDNLTVFTRICRSLNYAEL
jgi:hypothetical protein